ncbi:MAG TPA: EAL domain-containing protein [Thermoanaerobaculia bacterium]|jgi:diguanylate cyclase (GGDEF)-like protein|nr:EAL domain-containing protein [Thermoanaerobaculia bacterium]
MRVSSVPRYVAQVVALATILALLGLAAASLQQRPGVSLVYPATGLGAALLWGFGFRWWPVVFIAQFTLSYYRNGLTWVPFFVGANELMVTALFCWTMKRLRVSPALERLRDLGIFILGTLLTTAAGGLTTVAGEYLFHSRVLSRVVSDGVSIWSSDFVSILIFVPLVLGWRRWPFHSRVHFYRWLALTLFLIVIGAAIARSPASSATLFLLLPIVVFTAIVAGIPGAATSAAVLLFILLGMHLGDSPSRIEGIIRVIFVGTAAGTGYVLAVVWGEREQNARRLYELAHHDPLTGMYNRHELELRLDAAVSAGPPSAHALLYLDLDQFKLVNDTCGHIAGDNMLQELAGELQRAVPKGAKLARLGGDEFACIVLDASKDGAVAVANAIHDAMSRYRFRFGSMSFAVGVSIGITFFPAEDGDTADAVLGRADIACYVAKENGRHRSHVYLPRDEVMLRWHSSIQQVSQLEMAMENGGLQLWSQSIIDIAGGAPANFCEVLLRLNENGVIRTSSEFLPVAQRFGLMDRIDRWVLEITSRYLAETSDREVRLSVNVSGSTLNDPSFYETVIALPERFGFDPRRLCLEVTEGVMIHRLRQAVEAMKGLRARGFDLALDDFGAGVASFAYLQELPVTYVKIDGRIVQQLPTDPASEVIVGALVRLARLRNIECIAEWVESQETLERLRALGVRYAQGFHLHRPAPLHGSGSEVGRIDLASRTRSA